MSKNLFHDFFYRNEYRNPKTSNVWYDSNKFYSFNTLVALKFKGKLLLSLNKMTRCTGRHLDHLREACPWDTIVYVPLQYGESYQYKTDEEIVNILADKFSKMIDDEIKAKKRYTVRNNRDNLKYLVHYVQVFNDEIKRIKGLAKIIRFSKRVLNEEAIKNQKEKIKKEAQKQAKRTKQLNARISKRLKCTPFWNKLEKYVFNSHSRWSFENNKKYMEYIQERDSFFNQYIFHPSFIKYEDGLIKTSQRLSINVDKTIIILLKAWKHGKNIVGQQVGPYTVLANNENMVKVGCHNIPVENVRELYKVLVG